MKRRSAPASSQTLARIPGYFDSRLSSTSLMVAASTSTVSAPAVNFLSGVGITTLSDMVNTPKYSLESGQLRLDHLRRGQIQRIQRLQAISRNSQDRQIGLLDASLSDQFLSHCNRHTARRLREYA